MYFYLIDFYGYETTLIHRKKFTEEEFKEMAEEMDRPFDNTDVVDYLVKNYGFYELEYEQVYMKGDY